MKQQALFGLAGEDKAPRRLRTVLASPSSPCLISETLQKDLLRREMTEQCRLGLVWKEKMLCTLRKVPASPPLSFLIRELLFL